MFAKGEPVVFSSPLVEYMKVGEETGGDDVILLATETEGTVVGTPVLGMHPILKCEAWKVPVLPETGEVVTVWALSEPGRLWHRKYCDNLADAARRGRGHWKEFWRAKEAFADLRPAYALTVHKSQGSTFATTLVDAVDIMNRNSKKWEALRCLYVAVSRSAEACRLNASAKAKS